MKKMHGTMLAALIVAGFAAPAAMAQGHGNDDNHGNHGMHRGHGPKHMPPGQMRHEDDVPPRWADQPHREWHKGDRLPGEFRDRQYVVEDWRGYHLSAARLSVGRRRRRLPARADRFGHRAAGRSVTFLSRSFIRLPGALPGAASLCRRPAEPASLDQRHRPAHGQRAHGAERHFSEPHQRNVP